MTKKALLFACALAAACSGAAFAAAPSGEKPGKSTARYGGGGGQHHTTADVCEAAPCEHVVKIDTSKEPCEVVFEPELMLIKTVHDARITWKLDDSVPQSFTIVEVKFKDQIPAYLKENERRIKINSSTQFKPPKIAPDGRSAETYDKNTVDGSWYYDFKVTDGKIRCERDPPLVNGN